MWIRLAGSALALLLLMTSPAVADSSVQQLETNVRASLATIGSSAEVSEPASVRPSMKAPAAPAVSEFRAVDPVIAAVHRLVSLTGGWRVSAGISPGSQVLGVDNGHVVQDHWMNFHLSVGLPLR